MKHYIFGLFFILVNHNLPGQSSTKKLDTLKPTPYKPIAKPEIFETAFFVGTEVKVDTMHLKFHYVDIGNINIESGKIIACDPILMRDMESFTQTFPLGQFPVHLAIAKFHNDERIAFSKISFSDKPVVKWEFALKNNQKQVSIFGDTFYSYSVDAGIGLFIDEKAKAEFIKDDYFLDTLFSEMDKNTHTTWQFGFCKSNAHNLVAFSTGFGDGHYATYVGYDDKDKPCRLLTDFGLVQWWTTK